MTSFEIGPELTCDLPVLMESRLLIQANSGGGKSWSTRRVLEQTFHQVQHIVIDPEGEYATLREKFDYLLAAKQGGDTAADVRSAAMLATRLLELKASAILDIYELKHHERIRFVRLFLEALVNAPKRLWQPVMVVVDEAHVYCPEKGHAESAGAVIDLATRGRKRGFCAILATQRLSKLSKDAAAECNNKMIGRCGLDVDMRRAAEELGLAGREERHELRTLNPGEFFVFGPALTKQVTRTQVGSVQTTHPKAGSRQQFVPPPPTAKIRSLLPQLGDLPKEAEQEAQDNEALRKQVTQLRRELTQAKKGGGTPDSATMEREIAKATMAQQRSFQQNIQALEKDKQRLERQICKAGKSLLDLGTQLSGAVDSSPSTPPTAVKWAPIAKSPEQPLAPSIDPSVARIHDQRGVLKGPEQRIINAIWWFEAIGIEHPEQTAVAFMAHYTYGAGAFNNARGSLRVRGMVVYLPGDKIALTDEGRLHAEVLDIPGTNAGFHAAIFAKLQGPHQRLLAPLIEAWPESLTNEDLAQTANYTPGAGAFNNARGRLRTMGLIDYPEPGRCRARDLLFPENR